jgi:hypothetical protein
MKSGLAKLFAFFAFIVIAAYALQALIDHGMRRIHANDIGALNDALAGKVNARIVINGSSRAMSHYDPDILRSATGESTFNLGRNGSQTDIQVAVLKAYLRHNATPEIVIQNLDHFSLLTTRELYDPGRYIPYLDEPEIYHTVQQITPDAWKWKYLPLYGYAVEDMRMTWFLGLRQSIGFGPRVQKNLLGYLPRTTTWNSEFAAFAADNPNGVTVSIEPKAVDELNELADICHSKGIQLILVYSPEYYSMQKLVNNRREIFGKFEEIARRAHAPLWDYSDSSICKSQDYFSNSQHLNRNGAEAFSAELGTRLAGYLKTREVVATGHPTPTQTMTQNASNPEMSHQQ